MGQENVRALGDALVKHAEAWFVGLKAFLFLRCWWHLKGQQGRRGHEGAELDGYVIVCHQERAGPVYSDVRR